LERAIPAALRLTERRLLVRLDSGHDALDSRVWLGGYGRVDYILKWNPRQHDQEAWLAYAEQHGDWTVPQEGKRVALSVMALTQTQGGKAYRFRRAVQATERTRTASGQLLLLPDIEVEGWWASLEQGHCGDAQVIAPSAGSGQAQGRPVLATPPPNKATASSRPTSTSSACRPASSPPTT
jgi:hypothetical protein